MGEALGSAVVTLEELGIGLPVEAASSGNLGTGRLGGGFRLFGVQITSPARDAKALETNRGLVYVNGAGKHLRPSTIRPGVLSRPWGFRFRRRSSSGCSCGASSRPRLPP